MQLAFKPLMEVEGLQFFKLLGCGGGNGFSVFPDFGRYALLTVWKSEEERQVFESNSPIFKNYRERCSTCTRYRLHPVGGRGTWNGIAPFEYGAVLSEPLPYSILTRASIRRLKLFDFWTKVPGVSKRAEKFPGANFSIGIGEWPLVEQATFSVWKDLEAVKNFAYRDKIHKRVVELTRKRNWYSEELFVRFQLIEERVM